MEKFIRNSHQTSLIKNRLAIPISSLYQGITTEISYLLLLNFVIMLKDR